MKFNVVTEGLITKVHLGGSIDEDADFSQLKVQPKVELEMHLKDVTSINSCGIREWIKWFSTLAPTKVTFFDCPKPVVDQMNIVQGFVPPNSQIKSFYVPYFHEESGSEKSILFQLGHEYDEAGQLKVPEIKDDEGHEMEMDIIESKYFRFIKKSA